ncbi:MAG: hypothetical protein IPN34_23780 [Planctomycetes bacterium]|nr:hypothetical protein [Planctomycetota bacterium]
MRDELDAAIDQAIGSALHAYLEAACWAGDAADGDAPTGTVADPELRRLLLTEIKRLVPRPRGSVERVELSGRGLRGRRAILTRETHKRIDRALDSRETAQAFAYEGELREIDLDERTFTLRNDFVPESERLQVFSVPCSFEEALRPSAIEALDRRVRVSGELTPRPGRGPKAGKLHVTRLVILDEEESDPLQDPR